jgi:hypothetical protein
VSTRYRGPGRRTAPPAPAGVDAAEDEEPRPLSILLIDSVEFG